MMTFPQVVIDGEPLGGFQELVAPTATGALADSQPEAAAAPAAAAGTAGTRRSRARRRELAHRARRSWARLALAPVHEEWSWKVPRTP